MSNKIFKEVHKNIDEVKENLQAVRDEIKQFGKKLSRAEKELALLDKLEEEKMTNEEVHRRVQPYRQESCKGLPFLNARDDYNKNMELLSELDVVIEDHKATHERIKKEMLNNIVTDENIRQITDAQNALAADLGKQSALVYRSNASAVMFWDQIKKNFPNAEKIALEEMKSTLN